jgi:hypothetical protein
MESCEPFVIKVGSKFNLSVSFTIIQLNSAFNSLISLFYSQSKLIIDEHNCDVFTYFAIELDNPSLLGKCNSVYAEHSEIFKFTSESLTSIPHDKEIFLMIFH